MKLIKNEIGFIVILLTIIQLTACEQYLRQNILNK